MNIIVNSENETITQAEKFSSRLRKGDLILLNGTLGMGKSVFARSLIRTLLDDKTLEIPSPTFTLVQSYEGPQCPVYHYDLYRLEDPEEIFELGWDDALAEGITIVEWPERLGPYKPQRSIDIHLASVENKPHAREILIQIPAE